MISKVLKLTALMMLSKSLITGETPHAAVNIEKVEA